jgi:hypothetical protein
MYRGRGVLLGCVAVAAWLVASCTDATELSTAPQRRSALLGTLVGDVTSLLIAPAQRKQPLASDVSWTFTAGPSGAVSSNSTVGLTVAIPSGALSSTQEITVTALAGSAVAYGFSPHLVFAKNVSLTQDLRKTTLDGLLFLPLLSGAHFTGDVLTVNSDGLALVDEVVSALANPLTRTVTFGVGHFTGWIVASGKSSDGGQ